VAVGCFAHGLFVEVVEEFEAAVEQGFAGVGFGEGAFRRTYDFGTDGRGCDLVKFARVRDDDFRGDFVAEVVGLAENI
jgi:hypothetical protein